MKESLKINFEDLKNIDEIYRFVKSRVKITKPKNLIRYVVACDVYYSDYAYTSCILFDINDFITIEESKAITQITSEYRSGYFALREAPPIIAGLKKIYSEPDCIIVDGHGIAHPQNAGLASFIGVIFEKPSFGIAKTPLVGVFRMPKDEKGAWEPIYYNNEKVGEVIRTRVGSKPVFCSPGHLIDFTTAREMTIRLIKKQKIPEPLYLAHRKAKIFFKEGREV
jgi:deoxyribonuclease V